MRTSAKSFNIKGGYCSVYRDRLEINQHDVSGRVGKWLFQRGILSAAPLYLVLAILLLLGGGLGLVIQNYFLTFFLTLAAFMALYFFMQNRKYSFVPLILRQQIEKVHYEQAVPGKSRASFNILFAPDPENRPEWLLHRKLILPNTVHKGTSVADTAFWILKDEGLIKDRQS
ncbi:MAG: hypothetical protein AAFY71_08985 [Bacteroidota bacterium]